MTTRITVDIVSDAICPWCFIGKRRLEQALAQAPQDVEVLVAWRPYQLNPDMPPEGMDRQQYLQDKFGGPEGAERVYSRVRAVAEESGLDLKFDAIPRTPNTFDAHRLIRWAKATGHQTAVVQQLFRRYFELGQDISERETLLDAAEAAGMEREVVGRLLESDAERAELAAEEDAARRMGVTGVPCFIIGGRYVLQGAQDPETWKRVLRELDAAMAAQPEDRA
jgi:predicted DsbA family dithiol-disulfide isomerase